MNKLRKNLKAKVLELIGIAIVRSVATDDLELESILLEIVKVEEGVDGIERGIKNGRKVGMSACS